MSSSRLDASAQCVCVGCQDAIAEGARHACPCSTSEGGPNRGYSDDSDDSDGASEVAMRIGSLTAVGGLETLGGSRSKARGSPNADDNSAGGSKGAATSGGLTVNMDRPEEIVGMAVPFAGPDMHGADMVEACRCVNGTKARLALTKHAGVVSVRF